MNIEEFESTVQICIFFNILAIFYLIISILFKEKLYKKELLKNYFGTINCFITYMIVMLFIFILYAGRNSSNDIKDYINLIEYLLKYFTTTILIILSFSNSIPFAIILMILWIILTIKTRKYFKIKSFLYYFAPVFLTVFFIWYTIIIFNNYYGEYAEMKLKNNSQKEETIENIERNETDKTFEKNEWWLEK